MSYLVYYISEIHSLNLSPTHRSFQFWSSYKSIFIVHICLSPSHYPIYMTVTILNFTEAL